MTMRKNTKKIFVRSALFMGNSFPSAAPVIPNNIRLIRPIHYQKSGDPLFLSLAERKCLKYDCLS